MTLDNWQNMRPFMDWRFDLDEAPYDGTPIWVAYHNDDYAPFVVLAFYGRYLRSEGWIKARLGNKRLPVHIIDSIFAWAPVIKPSVPAKAEAIKKAP